MISSVPLRIHVRDTYWTFACPGNKTLIWGSYPGYRIHCRRVGSIFRLRGHQKCKPQIESRSRNLITKWKYKIKDILKLTPPNPLLKRSVCITLCLGHIFCKNLTRYGLLSHCRGRALQYEKRLLPRWTICAFRVLNPNQWSLTKQSSLKSWKEISQKCQNKLKPKGEV